MTYANHIGYSDITPFEIVRTVSDKTLEIREMKAVRANPENQLGFAPGGFFGHCSRQDEQEWIITSDLDRPVKRIRLNARGQWKDKWGNRYSLANEPRKFYDYNF